MEKLEKGLYKEKIDYDAKKRLDARIREKHADVYAEMVAKEEKAAKEYQRLWLLQ